MTDSKSSKFNKGELFFLMLSIVMVSIGIVILVNIIEIEKDGFQLDPDVEHTCESLEFVVENLKNESMEKYPTLRQEISDKQKELGC